MIQFSYLWQIGVIPITERVFLDEILALRGVTGGEYRAAQAVADMFRRAGCDSHVDRFGNVISVIYGTDHHTAPFRLVVDAHMDEIGTIVTGYEEGGFLRLAKVAGVDPKTLPATIVEVHATGDDSIVPGVIGVKPPHLLSAEDRTKTPTFDILFVDTGLPDQELRQRVRIGDYITPRQQVSYLAGDKVAAKALDDRIGVYTMLSVAQMLQNTPHRADVYLVASVQEERHDIGPVAVAEEVQPDLVIALDVGFGDQEGTKPGTTTPLGEGPCVGFGPATKRELSLLLERIAKEGDIPVKREVSAGDTGTDKDSFDMTFAGIPSACISIPLRNMHTQTEVVSLADVDNTAKLLVRLAETDPDILRGALCY